MDHKLRRRLRQSFEKRRGRFAIPLGTPAEIAQLFLDELLDCPDCRAAVLEACNGDDRKTIDIDEVLRGLALSHDQ
jgi:hypothetical protein